MSACFVFFARRLLALFSRSALHSVSSLKRGHWATKLGELLGELSIGQHEHQRILASRKLLILHKTVFTLASSVPYAH